MDHLCSPGKFSVGFCNVKAKSPCKWFCPNRLKFLHSRREGEMDALCFGPKVNDHPSLSSQAQKPCCSCDIDNGVFLSPLACIHFLFLRALLALHIAAPAHLALARSGQHAALCVMATPTADGVTVLVLVAFPCCCPCWVYAGLAEVGRVLDVQELRGSWERCGSGARWCVGQPALTFSLVCGAGYLECVLISLLQHHADFVKWR